MPKTPNLWTTKHIWMSYLDYCHWAVCLPLLTTLSNPPWHHHLNTLSRIQISFHPFLKSFSGSPLPAAMSSHSLARLMMPLAIDSKLIFKYHLGLWSAILFSISPQKLVIILKTHSLLPLYIQFAVPEMPFSNVFILVLFLLQDSAQLSLSNK